MTTEEQDIFKKRLHRGTFDLEPDFWEGFKRSVRSSQQLLALEYLIEYLTDLQEEVDSLKDQLAERKLVPSTKASAKPKAAEVKVEESVNAEQ